MEDIDLFRTSLQVYSFSFFSFCSRWVSKSSRRASDSKSQCPSTVSTRRVPDGHDVLIGLFSYILNA